MATKKNREEGQPTKNHASIWPEGVDGAQFASHTGKLEFTTNVNVLLPYRQALLLLMELADPKRPSRSSYSARVKDDERAAEWLQMQMSVVLGLRLLSPFELLRFLRVATDVGWREQSVEGFESVFASLIQSAARFADPATVSCAVAAWDRYGRNSHRAAKNGLAVYDAGYHAVKIVPASEVPGMSAQPALSSSILELGRALTQHGYERLGVNYRQPPGQYNSGMEPGSVGRPRGGDNDKPDLPGTDLFGTGGLNLPGGREPGSGPKAGSGAPEGTGIGPNLFNQGGVSFGATQGHGGGRGTSLDFGGIGRGYGIGTGPGSPGFTGPGLGDPGFGLGAGNPFGLGGPFVFGPGSSIAAGGTDSELELAKELGSGAAVGGAGLVGGGLFSFFVTGIPAGPAWAVTVATAETLAAVGTASALIASGAVLAVAGAAVFIYASDKLREREKKYPNPMDDFSPTGPKSRGPAGNDYPAPDGWPIGGPAGFAGYPAPDSTGVGGPMGIWGYSSKTMIEAGIWMPTPDGTGPQGPAAFTGRTNYDAMYLTTESLTGPGFAGLVARIGPNEFRLP